MAAPAPRSWAQLHADMLREILRRVPCAIDRLHMSVACISWRVVLAAEAMDAPPRIPSLFLLPADATGVYCYLSGCRDHRKFPGPRHFGSYDGSWFFLAYGQTRGHRLLNIRTGESRAVPNVLGVRDGVADRFHNMVILAATLSLPPDDLDCIAAGIVAYQPNAGAPRRRHFAFWQLGDRAAFCYVEPHPNAPVGPGMEPEDVVYHGGSFHFLTQGEHILECAPVLDDIGFVLEVTVDLIRFQNAGHSYAEFVRARYLVASREELLMVVRFAPNPQAPTSSFKVFRKLQQQMPGDGKKEADEYHWNWSELDTLGGRMLFVGRGCSRSYEVDQYVGFKDGVYFLDDGCFYDDEIMFRGVNDRRYSCSDIGKWSEGPPPHVERFFPEQGPSCNSPPAWLLP
ncbi:uncharacterized protein LOC120665188 [Panicum virgatum]|uniref:KIB1-4 beta-propeller domain-containing protein n=1 Tax=Panicum virgatum TaxID=38727 RepID=A0A8T0U8S0_PANVG|nr:uncharacterized protein LOC120665188 [Panicum virgatum]KAG2618667.1 hypothetical protein PVAP13_3NG079728 [Panicum virgatum]